MVDYYKKFSETKPGWDSPVIIESHINGLRAKHHNPNIPVGYDEIAAEAVKCWEAGACAIHVHNSNIMLSGEVAYEDYMKAMRPALDKCPDMFWYSTAAGLTPESGELSGVEHIVLLAQREGMRLCVLDCGSANLPFAVDDKGNFIGVTYSVPFDKINLQVQACIENDIGMIWGVYESGYLRTALQYIKMGRNTKGSSIDLYFQGDYGTSAMQPINTCGIPPSVENLYFYLNMMEGCELPWFISIWGEGDLDTRPLIKRAIELGGHVKTGLELHFDPDRKPTNIELLKEVHDIAKEVGRPIARQDEVKQILGLE
ncbi:MAG: 3-keto-5-aminohexanoate cleavage protein [Oscillospiraceae bacterium]|nr:3-keto-5-aminohexanoate cleavage protein [Oscillospiraceae bacterium]